MLRQLNKALKTLDLTDADAAAVELARTYARALDNDPDNAKWVGPYLLQALDALGMTPRARAAFVKGGGRERATRSPLDEVRERRRARRGPAEDLDTSAS